MTCADAKEEDGLYNSGLVAPDGMNVFFAGGGTVRGYRVHTVVPHTPSPTEALAQSPVIPTSLPTPGETISTATLRDRNVFPC